MLPQAFTTQLVCPAHRSVSLPSLLHLILDCLPPLVSSASLLSPSPILLHFLLLPITKLLILRFLISSV